MTGHQLLALITVAERSEGAKWSCACGACGFCYPDGWDADADRRAAALYAAAQDQHRRHVARAIVTDDTGGGPECPYLARGRAYCRVWP